MNLTASVQSESYGYVSGWRVFPFEVRRPIEQGPTRWHTAMTISRHRRPHRALLALARQARFAARQGGYTQDRVCQWDGVTWVPLFF